jgi:hypothetical protein
MNGRLGHAKRFLQVRVLSLQGRKLGGVVDGRGGGGGLGRWLVRGDTDASGQSDADGELFHTAILISAPAGFNGSSGVVTRLMQ